MADAALLLADEGETEALGQWLGAQLRIGDVVTLAGTLGAGKTTLARGILGALGLKGEAPSPSFAIVIPYTPPEVRLPIAHVDLYRLEEGGDVRELGLDELASDGVLLVEWADRLADAWPHALALTLDALPEVGRRLTWGLPAAWAGRWPPPLQR